MLRIDVYRSKKSYKFKANENEPDSFSNNWANNSKDLLILSDDGAEIFRCNCQSVANYCFGEMAVGDTVKYGDTIAPGEFTLSLFTEPRNFHGEIHAITQTRDIDGQWINHDAMQITNNGFQNGRWLIHDRYSQKTGSDTNYAWSAGCIILSSGNLEALNTMFHAYKLQAGDTLPGYIHEEESDGE